MKRFFIIPGLPRCATTSFSQILGQHPQILLPKIKEPHYFLPGREKYFMFNSKGDKIPFSKSGFVNNEKEFKGNYENFPDDKVYIDGSTLYAVHAGSMREIYKQKDIDPFFIILKRAPFKRAISHYLYSVSRGEEFRKFNEAMNDEVNNLYPDWLLGGYIAGSDSSACEKEIVSLWGASKLITANIDSDDIFTQEFMNKVLAIYGLADFAFDFTGSANTLAYTDNKLVMGIRIFLKRVRQLNPMLFDNKVTRQFFNVFMRSVPVKKDIYADYLVYEDSYNKLFNSRILA